MAPQTLGISLDDRAGPWQSSFERQLTERLVDLCEEERRRIGAELHDGVGQHLAGIVCLTAALRDRLRKEGSSDAAKADVIVRHLNDAIELTRAQARGLYPVQVEECGLAAALEDLTNQIERLHGVNCSLAIVGTPIFLEPGTALHLYRIAQEAINNAIRHGGADRIHLRLEGDQTPARLVIEDNGRGFSPGEPGLGLGLHVMGHRAAMIDGTFRVFSPSAGGTRVECSFPRGSGS